MYIYNKITIKLYSAKVIQIQETKSIPVIMCNIGAQKPITHNEKIYANMEINHGIDILVESNIRVYLFQRAIL